MIYLTEKKKRVLGVLQDCGIPLGIHAILSYLPISFKERSVRRWLSELSVLRLIEKIGQKKATKYQICFHSLQETNEIEPIFSEESKALIAKIRRPIFERLPISYQEEWIQKYQPNHTYYLPQPVRSKLLTLGKRSKEFEPAGTYARQIFNRLLIDLSYNSSRLEGNTYSLVETQKLLLDGVEAHHKSKEEKIMILNHKEAIRFLVHSSSQITKNSICTLHYLLSDELVEPKYAGRIRDHGVRIGGSTYIPYENPKDLLRLLELISIKASQVHDPYEQSFFLLVHLSYLQAFTDVNKRCARLSANIPFINNNLVPLSFNDVQREDYTSAMIAVYELQNVQPLIDLYLFSYERTCILYDVTLQSLGIDMIRVRYRKQRRELLAKIILKKITSIEQEAKKHIPLKDLPSFIKHVQEDLKLMDETRLYGLGITPEEYRAWRGNQRKLF